MLVPLYVTTPPMKCLFGVQKQGGANNFQMNLQFTDLEEDPMMKQFFEFIQKNQQMQQQLRAPIYEDKVVDHIFEQAAVTDKKVDKTELQKAVEALDED